MRRLPLLLLWLAAAIAAAATAGAAEAEYPALTGRVVDEAGKLPAATVADLTATLAAHEETTGNQVVVAILKSLRGHDIADYGVELGRRWGIGKKGKDNGVLLLIAPAERKLRIEVGYGLEGSLPDALAKEIIDHEMVPALRRGDLPGAVTAGVAAVLQRLGGEAAAAEEATAAGKEDSAAEDDWMVLLLVVWLVGFFAFLIYYGKKHNIPLIAPPQRGYGSVGWSGGSSGDSGGGSFSGGGGSFGGGGASGEW